jgi:hypothetical protein
VRVCLFESATASEPFVNSPEDTQVNMGHQWNDTDKEKSKDLEQTHPTATLSTTNPTRTDLGVNLGLHGEKPATNRLSHGMANSAALVQ